MRKYSAFDLLRFKRFADENPNLRPIDLVKAYNNKYPELSAKEQYENIVKMLDMPDNCPICGKPDEILFVQKGVYRCDECQYEWETL